MKNKLVFLFLLLSLLVLAGCQAPPETQADIPLQEVMRQALKDPDAFIPYTAEDLYDLTGISPEDYSEALFLRDRDTLSGREAILIRAKDAQAVQRIKEALEHYLSQRKEETRNYLPNAYRLLCDAAVQYDGLTVSLLVQ